ncbi:hypothetical protein CEE63_03070 [Stenotrophomonas maltophilia]|uniref:Uncharacterized protein n=1 Tax=Stenotrophomonas maltophilia TaxID=40324 RepID=A0A246IEI5_STEMA|nr:hypothetical protein CEE63_03070 [Stenotrophomonas maltophilia]
MPVDTRFEELLHAIGAASTPVSLVLRIANTGSKPICRGDKTRSNVIGQVLEEKSKVLLPTAA